MRIHQKRIKNQSFWVKVNIYKNKDIIQTVKRCELLNKKKE